MKIQNLLFFCYFSLFLIPAYAGGGVNVSSLVNEWGGGGMSLCGTSTLEGTEACIGASAAANCGKHGVYARDYTDEFGMQMMVARKVTERGAYFCPTQLEGKNKNKGNAWTEAADLNSTCVWLCKKGYTGSTCELTESAVKTCDTSLLRRSDYSNIARASSGANIEESIAMFYFNKYDSCGHGHDEGEEEHDMILAITGWLPSGHGAKVRQMVWRAQREGWRHMISWAAVYPATNTEEIVVCKNGYRPNYNNTDCEEINPTLCQAQSICDGWADFDESIHTLYQANDNQDCYQFRCTDSAMGFVSAANRTCEVCAAENISGGVSPADGTCVQCPVGQIFDEDAAAAGYCVNAVAYSKTDLMYGKGKTKSSDLNNQCWLELYPSDYKACVEGNSGNNTNNNTGNTSNTLLRAEFMDNTGGGLNINNINTAGSVIGTTMGVAGIMPAN